MSYIKKADKEIIERLQNAIGTGLNDVPVLMKYVINHGVWTKVFDPQTQETILFESIEHFIKAPYPIGLGIELKQLYKLCSNDYEAIDLISKAIENPQHGGDRRSENFMRNNVTHEKPARGNSTENSLKQLRNKNPDLHAKTLVKKISLNRAMIEVGLRQRYIYISRDIAKACRTIRNNFTQDEIDQFIKNLSAS